MTRNSSSEARNIKDGQPFCWQEKGALRLIRQSFEGDTSSALLTYVALTEIASDQKSETFQASASYIASKAKLTSRTVTKFIEPLEKLKLIAVKRTKVPGTKAMASNTYTLLNVVNLFPYRKRQGSKLSENRRIKNKETHPSDGHSSPPAQSTHPSTKDDTSAAPTRSVFEEKEDGYLIGNRFFPSREANRIAAGNEDMLLAAKRAVRFQDGSVKEVK
jgi:hypothetical protein